MGILTVRKRGTKWEYRFEIANSNEKRKQISKSGFKTQSECLKAGNQALAEYNQVGQVVKPSEISLGDYMHYWLNSYVKINLTNRTYENYNNIITKHIIPKIGQYKLRAITPETVQNWINSKKVNGYSKSMLAGIFSTLSGALRYAVQPLKYIQYSPCEYCKIPKVAVNTKAKEHTDYICVGSDWKKISDHFNSMSNFHVSLMLGYYLGCRIGETFAITADDIDFEKCEIKIVKQLVNEKGSWYLRPPKDDSFRTIKMGETIRKILHDTIERNKQFELEYGDLFAKNYVTDDSRIIQMTENVVLPFKEVKFINIKDNGELLTSNSFKYPARVIHFQLGIPHFHYHCLRHTHATLLIENGVSPKAVQERLGHKDVTTTLNKYTFNTDKMQQHAVEVYEKIAHT